MGGWSEILAELQATIPVDLPGSPIGAVDLDGVRRRHIRAVSEYTGRPLVVYAADFTNPAAPSHMTQVGLDDIPGFMEVFKDLPGPNLDLILHTPGGQVEATAKIIEYTRHRYSNVRVIVPQVAMSAGTILACSANDIVMGAHSQLGPIDPQFLLPTGPMPAGSIRRQFEAMRDDIASNPQNLAAYVPTLQQYPPGLLDLCEKAERLSQDVVRESLTQYMFGGEEDAEAKAAKIAAALSDSELHLTHGRPLGPDSLEKLGLHITRLESDAELQDRVLSAFHAVNHTFSGSAAAKIIENSNGRSWIRIAPSKMQMQMVPLPFGPVQMPPMPVPPEQPAGETDSPSEESDSSAQ